MTLEEAQKWLDSTDDYAWPIIKEEIKELKEELADQEKSFNLRWKADMRAIKQWQEVDPEKRKLVWPDHADLCVFLLEELDKAKERERQLRDYAQRMDVLSEERLTEISRLQIRVTDLESANAQLTNLLREVLASAVPNPKEHPTMWDAWKKAEAALTVPPAKQDPKCESCSGTGTVTTQSGVMSGICLTCMGSGKKTVPPAKEKP